VRILVHQGSGWVAIDRRDYAQEELLEQLIHESPEVIPLDSGVDRVVYARQFDCPPGYAIDLVGVGSDGGVSIVECKLAKNRESKRQVIGQILEYAAGLWAMTIDDFERRFIEADGRQSDSEGRSPFELLRDDINDSALAEADLRDRVASNLAAGRFRLLIAVDDISEQLQAIIRYVNAHTGGELKLVALALAEFADGATRVLVPTTFGNEAPAVSERAPAAPPVDPELQIRAARAEHQHALSRVHQALAREFRVEPRAKNIRYLDPVGGSPVATIWPSEGNLYGDKSTLSALAELQALAKTLDIRVTATAITVGGATDAQLETFLPAALVALSRKEG
jgi:hypothetical protein